MRILQVVAGVAPGGGVAESVPRLCLHLQRLGHEVTLATLAGEVSEAVREAVHGGVRLVQYKRTGLAAFWFSWRMLRELREECRGADVVHVHSLWTFPVWWGCWCAAREGKRLVVSPRGALDPVRLAHSAWKKRLVGWIDRRCVGWADAVHATSEMEAQWCRRWMGEEQCGGEEGDRLAHEPAQDGKVVVVPNGVAYPSGELRGAEGEREVKRVIYLGRKHPLKGLDLLEAAWEQVKRPGWELRVYGVGLADGLVEGESKWRVLREAELLVLPSRSESFGIVVAEALAVGLPVITTKGAPWSELEECGCGWWVEVSVAGLVAALEKAMMLSCKERRVMGECGRRLVQERYAWPVVAERMAAVYGEAGTSASRSEADR